MPKFNKQNQKGMIPLPLVLIAVVGVLVFLFISSNAPLRDQLIESLYPKPHSHAANLNIPPDLPKCSDVGVLHDRTKYHSLVHFQNSEDPNDPNRGAPVCHWDHTHGMNPNDATLVSKSVNGPNGTVTIGNVGPNSNGQSISYPWQTFKGAGENPTNPPSNPADLENGFKHNFYAWIVRTNMPCYSIQADADGCVTDFRWQEHADVSYVGAISRFHSYSVDARVCMIANSNDCGIIRMGGWIDYGHLQSPDDVVIPIAGDPTTVINPNARRLHQAVINNPDGTQRLCLDEILSGVRCLRNGDVTWYGTTRGPFSDGFNAEGYGPLNPQNPTQKLLYANFGHPANNGSWHRAEILSFWIRNFQDPDGVFDGRINFKGYMDRYGSYRPAGACSAASLDCIPVEFVNVPTAYFIFRDSLHNPNTTNAMIETDLTPTGIPSWIVYNDTYVPDPTPVVTPSVTPSASASPSPSSPTISGAFETYSANLTPVAGTGSSGSGKYTFDLACNPETSGTYAGQYIAVAKTSSPDTFVTGLLGNPYNAHLHYTSSGVPMKGIIVKNDPPVGTIQPAQWLSQMTIANTFTPTEFTAAERNEVRYQPTSGRPGTWINIHTNACPTCQQGELQGDVKKISGDCSATPSPTPAKKGDLNNDGKVGVLDFSILLTNWNATGSNPADLNNDSKVNVLDLSVLLTNWG